MISNDRQWPAEVPRGGCGAHTAQDDYRHTSIMITIKHASAHRLPLLLAIAVLPNNVGNYSVRLFAGRTSRFNGAPFQAGAGAEGTNMAS